jgi:aryl-alcohol dehydrogenase-like predicted oxidoreductase
MGLNYMDTAPAYGQGKSEEGLSRVIKECGRDKVFLTTKVSQWDLNRNQVYRDLFDSLSDSEQKALEVRVSEEIERRGIAQPDYFVNYFSNQINELESAVLCNVMEEQYGHRISRRRNYTEVILKSIDQSLKRLGTDYVDILMCPHGASTPYEMRNYPETLEAFETLKKAGKVRYLGVSAHTDSAGILDAAVEMEAYSVAMVAYNIVNHSFVEKALQRAYEADLGVIAMKVARPVYPGPNRGQADPARVKLIENAVEGPLTVPQKAYVWALRNRNLSAAVSAMEDLSQVEANLSLVGASGV